MLHSTINLLATSLGPQEPDVPSRSTDSNHLSSLKTEAALTVGAWIACSHKDGFTKRTVLMVRAE